MFVLWALLAMQAAPGAVLERALERLAEEAELFLSNVRTAIGTETLEQRALAPRSRFRPRAGAAVQRPAEEKWQTRRIVSEYAYATFAAPGAGAVHEFRTVRTVDGREVARAEKARALLARGVTSADDRQRHQMLRDFERHGLVGAVTDFGQTILLFRRTQLPNYHFTPAGRERLGADEALRLGFTQRGGEQAITIFEGSRAVRRPLEGMVWLRAADLLPLRIALAAEREEDGRRIRDEGTVEYVPGAAGPLLPASVVHRQWLHGKLVVENRYTYSGFRRFSAESAIRFEEEKPR